MHLRKRKQVNIWEEHRVWMLVNKVIRTISRCRKQDVRGHRKLYHEEDQNCAHHLTVTGD
jgi:hypothetical protein